VRQNQVLGSAVVAIAILAGGAALQARFGWRVPANSSATPADMTAQAIRSRRTLAELRRAGMQTTRSPVVINEVMTLNPGCVLDERMTASDWVELYNRSDKPVDLEGFGLSDSRSASRRWTFPNVLLPPRTHLLVWCSGRDEVSTPLSRTLRMVPTGDEPWSMEYDDKAPGGIAVQFEEDADSSDPYVVAFNVPEAGDYTVAFLARDVDATKPRLGETPRPTALESDLSGRANPPGEPDSLDATLSIAIDGGARVSMPVPAGEAYGWVTLHNPATTNGDWPFGVGLHRIAVRGGQGEVRVAQVSCRHRNRREPHRALHTSFRLAASGESVILMDPSGNILDYVTPPPMPPGSTYQRVSDGADAFAVGSPSPGDTSLGPPPDLDATPTFSESAISIPPPASDAEELRYTLDGSIPTTRAPLFTNWLTISGAYHRSHDGPDGAGPSMDGGTTSVSSVVLSVRGFTAGLPSTDTAIRQFWVGPPPDVPVLCIATEPAYLDYTDLGIFNRRKKRGRDWERRSHVLLFDGTDVAFDGLAGLRSHGWRHPDRTQNSFHINFRQSFGEERLRHNIVRPASDVRARCVIADASGHAWADHLAYDVARAVGGAAPHARPVLIFVNGRPYNLGTLVENVDESFLLDRWGHAEFDVIKRKPRRLKLGTWDRYRELHEYLRDAENLEQMIAADAARLLDVDSLTSWMLSIILCDASEGGKHITREAFQGYFYSDRTASPPAVGMIAWDVDCTFRCVDYNTLEGVLTRARFTTPVGAFRALLKNDPEYVRQFVAAAENALEHVFREDRLGPTIDLYDALYRRYAAHCVLGSKIADGEKAEAPEEEVRSFQSDWRETFDTARRVLRERPAILRRQIAETL